ESTEWHRFLQQNVWFGPAKRPGSGRAYPRRTVYPFKLKLEPTSVRGKPGGGTERGAEEPSARPCTDRVLDFPGCREGSVRTKNLPAAIAPPRIGTLPASPRDGRLYRPILLLDIVFRKGAVGRPKERRSPASRTLVIT